MRAVLYIHTITLFIPQGLFRIKVQDKKRKSKKLKMKKNLLYLLKAYTTYLKAQDSRNFESKDFFKQHFKSVRFCFSLRAGSKKFQSLSS